MAITPAVSAPLRVAEKPGPSGGISFGCRLDDDGADGSDSTTATATATAAADKAGIGDAGRVAGTSGAGIGAGADTGAASGSAAMEGWRRWRRRGRPQPTEVATGLDSDSSGGAGSAADEGRYAGSILLVSRGECTFEHKVSSCHGRPQVTQDNTPPGPILKARLLHSKKIVGPEQGAVGKIRPMAFRKRVVWYWSRTWCGVTKRRKSAQAVSYDVLPTVCIALHMLHIYVAAVVSVAPLVVRCPFRCLQGVGFGGCRWRALVCFGGSCFGGDPSGVYVTGFCLWGVCVHGHRRCI